MLLYYTPYVTHIISDPVLPYIQPYKPSFPLGLERLSMWPAVVTVLSQAERFEYLKYREVESWLFPIDRLVSRGKEGLGRWVTD